MKDLNWKRTEYDTWDDAFRGQVAAVRQQSVRVAAYTQVIFLQACADSYGKTVPNGQEQIKSQYGDLAFKCGLYHQLGKALVPPEYQLLQKDFTDEEVAVYRKYTSDGRLLVASLQEKGQRAKEKRRGQLEEIPTDNIPWQMIRDACEQHMERWDGSGFPGGRLGAQISPIAQIVGIAKELDRLAAETKRENPFEEAFAAIVAQADTLWSRELVSVLQNARTKCRTVFNKFIHYSMALPHTVPLVKKTKDRPFGLTYRPMICDEQGKVSAYEATSWFGAIANRAGETESAEEVQQMLVRTGLVADVSFYLLYEAADAVLRMENCKLGLQGVLINMLPGFYSLPTQLQRLNQLFEDQPIPKQSLMLTVPYETFAGANKTQRELMARYIRNGIALVLDGCPGTQEAVDPALELGFSLFRFGKDLEISQVTALFIHKLIAGGARVMGSADSFERMNWLLAAGVTPVSGTVSGVPVSEDELIRDRLLAED